MQDFYVKMYRLVSLKHKFGLQGASHFSLLMLSFYSCVKLIEPFTATKSNSSPIYVSSISFLSPSQQEITCLH